MSVLFSNPDAPTKINRVQINQSVQGYPLPVVMGKAKIQQSLLWVDGLSTKQVTQGGGKGLGGGKSGSSYLYSADVIAALCNGPIAGVGDVWSGSSWLSNSNTTESYVITGGSPTYTPVNAGSGVFVDGGVGVQTPYSSSQTDLGSGGPVTLSGTDLPAMQKVAYGSSLSTGQYSIDGTNTYHFAPVDAGKTVQIGYSFALANIKQQENDLVPSSKQIQVGGTFTFLADNGVVYFTGPNNGVALQKVSGTPTVTGTYSVSGSGPATYKFAPGDIGAEVQITYQIQNNSIVPTGAPGTLAFTIFEGTQGQAVWSLLVSNFPQAALGYTGIAYAAYDPMTMGYAADVQQNVFEVQTPDSYGGTVVDCNPIQCILQVLTNRIWGLGTGAVPFPTSAIDNGASGTWGGASGTPGARTIGSTAWNWFAANNFFISPVLDHQDTASSVISKWLEAGMCAMFMSEGLLKLVPYGDTSTAGNGATWVAPSAFAASLDDTCFIPKKKGEDPVRISSSPWQDAYNTVQIQWNNRLNQYAPEITPESDQAAINRYGSRIEDPQNYDFIHTLAAATFTASTRVKRNVYTRNTYEFTVPFSYSYLENMDVVNISTSSQWAASLNNENLGIVNLPVRIKKLVDNPNGNIDIVAEDYPFGVHQPSIYNKSIGAGQTQPNIFDDPGNTEVVLFEATSRLTGFKGNQIWMGACGVSDKWGGCNVFASQNGTTYKQVGTIDKVGRLGVLASTFANSANDPDTTSSLVVNMAENSAPLEAGTSTDADQNSTLAFVDGEVIAYSACAVTGQEQYTMNTYIRRAQMGTTASAHSAGGLFLRLDDAIFKYTYDPAWAGQTIYLKFQSVNTFGNKPQDLSTLTAVSFTVPGKNPGTIDASSGIVLNTPANTVGAGPLGWTPIYGPTTYGASINFGTYGYAGMASSVGGANSQYFYSRFYGYLCPTVTGVYTIGTNFDDGATLYIGGQVVGNNDLTINIAMGANLSYATSAKVLLTAGVYYPIVLEWTHGAGANYGLQLIWTPPKSSPQLIPAANFSTSGVTVTGNLHISVWNGSSGLYYPAGNGLTDPGNTVLYGPPNNGGGQNMVTKVSAVSGSATANAWVGAGSYTNPGWIVGQVWSAGGLVDLLVQHVPATDQGYLCRLDFRSGFPMGQILSCSNFASITGNMTNIGNGSNRGSYLSNNAAAITGWVNFAIYLGANGYKALWINNQLACDVTDVTYTGFDNFMWYGYEVNTTNLIGPVPNAPGSGSTGLNPQGSIIPNQPLATPSYTRTATSISFSWSSQSMALSDGSTVTIPAGSKSYTGLTSATTYYFYPYVRVSDFTIQWANGAPPPTAQSAAFALAANSDGCYSMNPIQAATTSSGSGSGGGGSLCPEASEVVNVEGKGNIPVGQVQVGDMIKGRCMTSNQDVYRKVLSVMIASCGAWRIVNEHKISPCEPVWDGKQYTPAYRMPGAVFDGTPGLKVSIHVDSDEYDECNFYLVDRTPLLIHNMQIVS